MLLMMTKTENSKKREEKEKDEDDDDDDDENRKHKEERRRYKYLWAVVVQSLILKPKLLSTQELLVHLVIASASFASTSIVSIKALSSCGNSTLTSFPILKRSKHRVKDETFNS